MRVRFAAPCAKAIANSKVGIGDEVELALDGARWVTDAEGGVVRTPGRGLDGELVFNTLLRLVVRSSGQEEQRVVAVDEKDAQMLPVHPDGMPSTPAARVRPRHSYGPDGFGVAVYSSPAFMKRLRLSESSFAASPYTPVSEDDDLDTDAKRKRRRVSYKNVAEWRFDAREPSPDKMDEDSAHANGVLEETITEDDVDAVALAQPSEVIEAAQQTPSVKMSPMPPPNLPRLEMPPKIQWENAGNAVISEGSTTVEVKGPATPRLGPIASLNLPLPSPFPTSSAQLQGFSAPPSPMKQLFQPMLDDGEGPRVESEQVEKASTDDTSKSEEGVAQAVESINSGVKDENKDQSKDGEKGEDGILETPLAPAHPTTTSQESDIPGQDLVEPAVQSLPSMQLQREQSEKPPQAEPGNTAALEERNDDLQGLEQAHSPSEGSEADVSDQSVYDEEEIANLQTSEDSEAEHELDYKTLTHTLHEEIDPEDLKDVTDSMVEAEEFRDEVSEISGDEKTRDEDSSEDDSGSESCPEEIKLSVLMRSDDEDDDGIDEVGDDDGWMNPTSGLGTWDPDSEKFSESEIDEDSFASQATPTIAGGHPVLESTISYGLDGAGFSKDSGSSAEQSNEARSPPATKESVLSEDEEAAWRDRDEAIFAISHQASSTDTPNLTGTKAPVENGASDYNLQDDSLQSSKPVTVVGIPAASGAEARKDMPLPEVPEDRLEADPSHAEAQKPDHPEETNVAEQPLDRDEEDVSPPVFELSEAPLADYAMSQDVEADALLNVDPPAHAIQTASPASEQVNGAGVNSITVSHESVASGTPDPVGAVLEESIAGSLVGTKDDDDVAMESSLDEIGTQSPGHDTVGQVVEKLPDNVVHNDKIAAPAGDEESATDTGEDVGSHPPALPLQYPGDMDIDAPDGSPASKPASRDVNHTRLTSSSFMTLTSPSSAPEQPVEHPEPIEEVDLSQVDPEYMVQSSQLRHSTAPQRPDQIPDSIGSPATTIFAGSSSRLSGGTDRPGDMQDPEPSTPLLQRSLYVASQDLGLSQLQETVLEVQVTPSRYNLRSQTSPTQRKVYTARRSTADKVTGSEALDTADLSTQQADAAKDELLAKHSSEQLGLERQSVTIPAEPNPIVLSEQPNAPSGGLKETIISGDTLLPDVSTSSQRETGSTIVAQTLSDDPTKVASEQPESQVKATAEAQTATLQASSKQRAAPAEPATPVKGAHSPKEVTVAPEQTSQGKPLSTVQTTKSRKSLLAKMSEVPPAISAWFAPRRSTALFTPLRDEKDDKAVAKVPLSAPPKMRLQDSHHRSVSPPAIKRDPSQGTSTALSYFHPLTELHRYLNQPGDTVDVVAVSASASSKAVRSKRGPKDFYTIFHITDPALALLEQRADTAAEGNGDEASVEKTTASTPSKDMRVEIFRPWKASLPTTEAGDVVLLRNFVVRSEKRKTYLLSGDASSWCVWRYSAGPLPDPSVEKGAEPPLWARTRRRRRSSVQEEIRGPPVDIGSEERVRAAELRKWWDGLDAEKAEQEGNGKGSAVKEQEGGRGG